MAEIHMVPRSKSVTSWRVATSP